MDFQSLAEKLIRSEKESERRTLLKNLSESNSLTLARTLKDTYYESWTNEPARIHKAALALKTLVKTNPSAEIKALSLWVSGINYLTKSKFAAAIQTLDEAAEIFQAIDKEYEAAQIQVAKLYPLALLGKYAESVKCGESALEILEKYGDELTSGKIEMNLGNTASRCEFHTEAEKSFLAAHRRFVKNGETKWLTMAKNDLAITYAALNRFDKAEKFYAEALSLAQAAKMVVTEAEIEASMGNLALFRGRLDRALNFLELSRRKYEDLQMPHQSAIAELEIADVYLELNLIEEAAAIYESVADKFHSLKMRGEEARARANFGRVAAGRNDLPTARKQLRKAARLYFAEGNKVGAATVKIAQANLELSQKNYTESLKIHCEIENLLSASASLRHRLAARFIAAEIRRKTGETAIAESNFRRIYTDALKYEQPNTAQAAQIALGKIACSRGDWRRAETHFKSAIRLIETTRAPLAAEEFRMSFLADKIAPFERLTSIYLAQNKIEKAFAMSERARARSLSENLEGKFNAAKSSPASSALRKKLAKLREELNWFYSRLNRADEAEIVKLQSEANKREKQIADVRRQIESANGNQTEVSTDKTKTDSENLQSLRKSLGEQRALIEFLNIGGVFSAFVVTDRKVYYFDKLAREKDILLLLESLQFQFGALRYGAENLGGLIADLKKRADSRLRKLHEKLFAPLEKIVDKRDLVIVPVGAAHYVPFHALFDGERYLVESRKIVHAPSATVWRFLASKPAQKSVNALLIGYADDRIPMVNQEIETLRKIFERAEIFVGEQASIEAFTDNAPHFDILHLACHGQFRPENPLFSSLHLADGRLTVRDAASLNLKAELVALSACETGVHKIFAGEEILGLARGFLSAGAKSLLLSLWTVNDEATTELMKTFYEQRQTGKSSAQSLQTAQKNFIERGIHPYYWSPFVLIGK